MEARSLAISVWPFFLSPPTKSPIVIGRFYCFEKQLYFGTPVSYLPMASSSSSSFSLHTIIEDKAGPSLYRDRKFDVETVVLVMNNMILGIRGRVPAAY